MEDPELHKFFCGPCLNSIYDENRHNSRRSPGKLAAEEWAIFDDGYDHLVSYPISYPMPVGYVCTRQSWTNGSPGIKLQ